MSDMKWIPVTERLPEESGMYLVTRREYDDADMLYFNEIYTCFTEDWLDTEEVTGVIAWMPLPEPYEEKQE